MTAAHKAGAAGLAIACTGALILGTASAAMADDKNFSGNVSYANAAFGSPNNVLASGLREAPVAWGTLPLANPNGPVAYYGYNTSHSSVFTQNADETFKTEPDKNVYLVFGGRHYLYQGHETGGIGYVTRINLDESDLSKRVTLIADLDANGQQALPTFDGITWDPFSNQLLLTAESKYPKGGVWAVTLDANGDAVDGRATVLPALGSGGYEGVQNDADGNVWLVEDVGGASAQGGKVPNSFVYRFVPVDKADLSQGGKLQALQVQGKGGQPVTYAQLSNGTDAFISDLHTYGASFATAWVTVHDTAVDGTDVFDATSAAKASDATPFKRPENGVFRPGTNFGEFYFTETGDTSTDSKLPGAFGGVFKIAQKGGSAATGTIRPVWLGDVAHTGFDNIAFAGRDALLVVEDAGDTLHAQRNALDSGYSVRINEGGRAPQVSRWLAEGRDASATLDNANGGFGRNDGDNEITGIHVSDGDPSTGGILGTKTPNPFSSGWRVFWTQQHGDNITYEVMSDRSTSDHGTSDR
ncbi:MAG: DUF839 domain-containing protein [Actinomycetales bacterium]|nr:DUF839 domain-containing protein [Actinomycetales bacterium]